MKEIEWRDVVGFEGLYQVSSDGMIRQSNTLKILSPNYHGWNGNWYVALKLPKDGRRYTVRPHRVVAQAFIPNPMGYEQVNHKDMNKRNNCVDNLEWCTCRMNTMHAIQYYSSNGMYPFKYERIPKMLEGMINYNQNIRPKPILQYTLDGKFVCKHKNGTEASKFSGVCQRNILQVADQTEYKLGKTRMQAGGFIWIYDKIKGEVSRDRIKRQLRDLVKRNKGCTVRRRGKLSEN